MPEPESTIVPRLRLYYRHLCERCWREQLRGSSAKRCSLMPPGLNHVCNGPLRRLPGKARVKALQIANQS